MNGALLSLVSNEQELVETLKFPSLPRPRAKFLLHKLVQYKENGVSLSLLGDVVASVSEGKEAISITAAISAPNLFEQQEGAAASPPFFAKDGFVELI